MLTPILSQAQSIQQSAPGARIQRTMTLLSTSTEQLKHNVKIVFYGQSIVRQDYARKAVEAKLRKTYPSANLTVKNNSIGGFTAPSLCRTLHHDLLPEYPDLVVFHVYDGMTSGDFERIIRDIRANTTAEIMLWTHHISKKGSRSEINEANAQYRRYIAQKYNCELVELRREWKQYLAANNLQAEALLKDAVHLNARGGKLMGEIIARHFQVNTTAPGGWFNSIKKIEAVRAVIDHDSPITFPGKPWTYSKTNKEPYDDYQGIVASKKSQKLSLVFTGNRVDLATLPVDKKTGSARILIDGKPVSAHSGAYAITRPSNVPGSGWPALKRVFLGKKPAIENWSVKFSNISADGSHYQFTAIGSKSGASGEGNNKDIFTSKNDSLRILPIDSEIAHSIQYSKAKASPFECKFSVYLMGTDTWKPKADSDEHTTVIQGLENTKHTLTIIPNGDGLVPLRWLTIHRPPLNRH